jgi:branched-chain amino acid transport system substrate-binding protein
MGRSNNALAVSDALQKHNERNPDRRMLLFVYEAGDPVLTESKCNFWTFQFNGHMDMNVNVLTDFMARQTALRKVYLINQDYAFGQSASRAAKEMLSRKRPDIRIVGDDFVPLFKVKDFAPYITKIRASGADSVLTSELGERSLAAGKSGQRVRVGCELLHDPWRSPRDMGDRGCCRRRTGPIA